MRYCNVTIHQQEASQPSEKLSIWVIDSCEDEPELLKMIGKLSSPPRQPGKVSAFLIDKWFSDTTERNPKLLMIEKVSLKI